MTVHIGMISQKGGVGKSTLSRLVAREYANAGWSGQDCRPRYLAGYLF